MFFDTSDLKDQHIYLKCVKTVKANKEKQYVPAYHFEICLLDNTVIGKCDLRVGHNENTYIGGNIGYEIFEDYRGHHYALKACYLLEKLAKKHDMNYLIIACLPDNIASYKTIERFGGRLLAIKDVDEKFELYQMGTKVVRIYRIDL